MRSSGETSSGYVPAGLFDVCLLAGLLGGLWLGRG